MENMTLEQLKAAAYDRIAAMERISAELKALNQEIAKRAQKPTLRKVPPVEEVKE